MSASIKALKSLKSNVSTCISLLKNLTNQGLIAEAAALHGHFIKTGTSSNRDIAIKLLMMYLNDKKLAEANEIVKEFNGFDVTVHNCLIGSYVKWGDLDEARRLFDEMPDRNVVSWTTLISGFMRYGRVKESVWYVERNPFHNVVSWTAAISGYIQNGFFFEGLKLFLKLLESSVRPNNVTFISVVKGCAESGNFKLGMSVFGLIVKVGFEANLEVSNSLISLFLRMRELSLCRRVFDQMEIKDVISWTAILDMYVEMGELGEARRVFNDMPERNVVSWSVMIARYSQSGYPEESCKLFHQMVHEGLKPNISCFSSALSALACLKALKAGMNIHAQVVKMGIDKDVFISCSAIDLYCKCGKIMDGRVMFDSVLEKNVVSWNTMISGYCLNGQMEEAKGLFDIMPLRDNVSWSCMISGYLECERFNKVFETFHDMLLLGETPNKSTFTSLLCACASITSLEKGKRLHGRTIKLGIQYEVFVGTALTGMYAKCGDIRSSRQVFARIPVKNEFSWTVMIQGLAESGFAEESLSLFEEMNETTSVTPNELILLSVLFACSHSGLIDKGLYYFNSMDTAYGVKCTSRHYTCMVDMLSRAGRLSEAEEFINSNPFQLQTNAVTAFLSGCKTYRNEDLAERAACKLLAMPDKRSSAYVLLSNLYASSGRWMDVLNIRRSMKENGLKKTIGCSWVEVRNEVHSFYAEDSAHFQSAEIYGILELLRFEMVILQKPCMLQFHGS